MSARPDPAELLALEIIDALMVVAPRGFRAVDLVLETRTSGSVRVGEITTHLLGDRPRPKPALGLETGAFHGVLNEALEELLALLASRGLDVPIARVRVDREGETRATLSFVTDAASAPLRTVTLDAALLRQRVFTEPLFDALLHGEDEMTKRQATLAGTINGHDDWAYDEPTETLTLTKGVLPWATLRAVPIGSYAHESETWLWAWANAALPDRAREATASVRDAARDEPGMSALLRPTLPCTEAFALRLAGVAALRMNARGVYGAVYGAGVLILAIVEGR